MLWVEDAWQPKLQRESDVGLMEAFLEISPTRSKRMHLRQVLHWLQVVTLADLANATGRFIPEGRLTGDWRAHSTLEWPHQPKPSEKAFALFRRFMRHTICLETSHWQHLSNSMDISTPMGEWLDVDRHIVPSFGRYGNSIYCQEENIIMEFTGNGQNGIYKYQGDVEAIPTRVYPINCQLIDGDKVWTRKKFTLLQTDNVKSRTPGTVKYDTLNRLVKSIKGASDGSLHREEWVMTTAWIIADSADSHLTATAVFHNVSSLSSYRAELEGAYWLLYRIEQLNLSPEEIIHWCDNEVAVAANQLDKLWSPSAALAPDAAVILALIVLKKKMSASITCHYVPSH
jgi:hypothetical protein